MTPQRQSDIIQVTPETSEERIDQPPVRQHHFTAVFEQDGDWWIGYVEELRGANTQGRTLEEARENLKEAVLLILQANRDLAEREIAGRTVVREDIVVTEG